MRGMKVDIFGGVAARDLPRYRLADAALVLGTSRSTVARWRRGAGHPRMSFVELVELNARRVASRRTRRRAAIVETDANGHPARLFPTDDRTIVVDPERRFGRPVLVSSNIETSVVADRLSGGDDAAEIARDLDISEADVAAATRFERMLNRHG